MSVVAVNNSYHRPMADNPKFDYGAEVLVTTGEHKRRTGCIVSINLPSPLGTYTVEFVDGSDAEIKEVAMSPAKHQ